MRNVDFDDKLSAQSPRAICRWNRIVTEAQIKRQ